MLEKSGKSFVIEEKTAPYFTKKITTWIAKVVEESHCKGAVLGMSGGIDCSVVARLCQLSKVRTDLVLMPYGDDMVKTSSREHSLELIEKFGFPYHVFDIKPAVDAIAIPRNSALVKDNASNLALSLANIRPRVRMTYLYQYAQANNLLVAGTGNLSERTIGYFTKWGDGGCDFNPIGMLTKKEVYILARYLQIPNSIIQKKPSAGLWEGQTDEEEIGITYAQIDHYLLNGTSGNDEIDKLIERKNLIAQHKLNPIPIFNAA